MTTLAAGVAIGDNQLRINAPMTDEFPAFVKIDTEILQVGGQEYRSGTTLVLSEPAQAAHDSGATVTYAGRPFDPTFVAATAGGGAAEAVTVEVPPAAPVAVTNIVIPQAVVAGEEATLPSKDFYAQDTDPGAVGAGSVWKNTTDQTWWTRRSDNTAWDASLLVYVIAPPDENPLIDLTVEADGSGGAGASLTGRTQGDGNANVVMTADALGTGNAYATLIAQRGGFSAQVIAHADTDGVYLVLTADAADRYLRGGAADPSAGAGVVGGIGSEYHRVNGGVGEFWYKTGAADTDWTKITP